MEKQFEMIQMECAFLRSRVNKLERILHLHLIKNNFDLRKNTMDEIKDELEKWLIEATKEHDETLKEMERWDEREAAPKYSFSAVADEKERRYLAWIKYFKEMIEHLPPDVPIVKMGFERELNETIKKYEKYKKRKNEKAQKNELKNDVTGRYDIGHIPTCGGIKWR
ncbi:MAG: hypothetical protein LBQ52_04635 [Helicobacteraceae bacterium]|nr:hypothetical protein [Helicobacteraceae bacterium]